MAISLPPGDLARARTYEADESWPTMIEIVAWYGKTGRSGRRKSITISADQFFGRGAHGAPITGDQLIGMIEALRRQT